MNNEDKLFELMTKMYAEMQNEFSKMRQEMKEGFNDVNFRMDNIENEIQDIKKDLNEFRVEANEGFDSLEDKLNNLEGTNAANHLTTKTKLDKISEDLDFLTHKEFQTEREMFHIKQKLSKQRRNIK